MASHSGDAPVTVCTRRDHLGNMGNNASHTGHNVLVLGLESAGKTSILARLLREDPRTVLPTLGFSIRSFAVEDGRHILKMWDVGGAAPVRTYWKAYYPKAHAIIFVIDSSDRRRLAETSMVLQQVLDADELLGLPLLLFASKQDLPDAIPPSELEVLLHMGSIRDRTWRCVRCSSITGKGIEEGLKWLIQEFENRAAVPGKRSGSSSSPAR